MIKRFIRIGGFVGKELVEIFRQPRLLLSLILGPFLILLLFGIGYVGDTPKPRTILVVPTDEQQSESLNQFKNGSLNVVAITADQKDAERRLNANEVDIVVVVPANAEEQIGAGGQAVLLVEYNTLDPLRGQTITALTTIYTNDINKTIIAATVQRSQGSVQEINSSLTSMDNSLAQADANLSKGDKVAAAGDVNNAQSQTTLVQASVGLLTTFFQPATITNTTTITTSAPSPQVSNLAQGNQAAQDLSTHMAALQTSLANPNSDPATVHQQIQLVRQDLANIKALTTQFAQINPFVFAAPFYGKATNISPLASRGSLFTVFYTPSVLALLMQHIAITLASLSMVRERLLGSIELFRVSPVTPGEILAGKYVGFGIFLSVLAVVLLALVNLALGVPIVGSYLTLALVMVLLIWASLGLGFAISMISGTESQAVQIAMLALLTSVFFSGFFLRLDSLWEPVRAISYALPVTHGIAGLQAVMLNGTDPSWYYLAALAGLGILFAAFSMWRFSSEFRRG